MAIWALVTGASEGLGREFATLAAKDGFDVILTARSVEKLEAHATSLRRAYNVAVEVIPADLTDPVAVERLWDQASAGRQIGILVNNAGLGRNGDLAEAEGWPREADSIAVNIIAATILLKRAAAHMKAHNSGGILNVASTAGFMPGPHMAVYHASKAYLLSLSEAVSEELRGTAVTVTALCPGPTATQFFASDGAEKKTLITRLPMPSAASVAQAGWAAMVKGRRVKVVGISNKIFAFFPRLAPRRLVAFSAGVFLKRRW
ncbi:short-chain dehydrogenase [Cypionkella aquatica]|uniref:Short-chain dehydrogenase n=1 Tax=Cypionkella aquatica TaxID=1756042 RepID=A0AA37X616_9RHOB|nr:SDR family oxidoreductase [Cypionkella aquatica]GLS87395.1 short-chain dehydrogenase [Cypionkella aquatica]GLS88581.1 short-chain dehydrogenase [Cypionkella aquatica]